MTDQEKNKKIAEWLGLTPHVTTFREYELEIEGCKGNFVEKKCSCGKITRLGKKHTDEDTKPLCYNTDYLNTNAAFDLLDVLVERGFSSCLHYDLSGRWRMELYFDGDYVTVCSYPTKTRAICEAVLALI